MGGGVQWLACHAPQDGVPCAAQVDATVMATVSHDRVTPALLRPSWSSVLARASRDDAAHSRDARRGSVDGHGDGVRASDSVRT